MERLKERYKTLLKAYKSLGTLLEKFPPKDEVSAPNDLIEIFRDSAIKRFEFCYDLTWKYLKVFLNEKYGIEANSPRSTFRECFSAKVVNEEESEVLLAMIDDRNMTTHVYDEAMAAKISKRIEQYFKLFEILAERCKP